MNTSRIIDENLDNDLVKNLELLGFSSKESLVYTSLLSLGEVGSSKIIKKTGLHGQYVYQALANLEVKGLVQHSIKNSRKRFRANNPSLITKMLDSQKYLAEQILPQLQLLMVLPPEQRTEVYVGADSYLEQEFSLLNSAPDGSELLIIGGYGDHFTETMGKNLGKYEILRLKKQIRVRYLGSEDQKELLAKSKVNRQLFDYRFLPGLFTGVVNTNIWQEAINFNIFGNPVTNISVYNPLIAGSYRQFFETIWKLGR
ncbi:MAG: helix-turn-helix domain-containing protein [bacterium]|nr:helix-turn-helix domain-containing protein [bacterium]